MAIAKDLKRSIEIENKNIFNAQSRNSIKERLVTSIAVIVVLLVISVVVWVSSDRNVKTGTSNDINVNIIHETNTDPSAEGAEEQYIEYEAPANFF